MVAYVLSFDIGIVNMAYCVLDGDTNKIVKWEVFSLCNSSDIENTRDLIIQLDKRPDIFDHVSVVLLEKQPKVNPKMRSMASALRMYLTIRGMVDKSLNFLIIDYSPKHKLRCWDGPVPKIDDKSDYRRRKKLALFQCEKLLDTQEPEIVEIFNKSQKKKDDLADCYLQGLSWLMFNTNEEPEVVIKRKPTSKQLRYSKYSKSNIKYLIDEFLRKTDTHVQDSGISIDDAIKHFTNVLNPKLGKCIKRAYGTNEDLFRKDIISPEWEGHFFDISLIGNGKKTRTKKVQEEELESGSE